MHHCRLEHARVAYFVVRQPMLVKDDADIAFGKPPIRGVVGGVYVHYDLDM